MTSVIICDVYDGDKLILENATRKEIETFFGCNINFNMYDDGLKKFRGRYTIIRKGTVEVGEDPFIKEWENAVAPFKKVEWCKEGGRKLRIGGRK